MVSNPIYRIFATISSFGPVFPRMMLAAIFTFHGLQKLFGAFGGDGWTRTMESFTRQDGMDLPYIVAALVILTEPLLAISFFFGFLTRVSCVAVLGIMAGAIYFVHVEGGFSEMEFPLSVMAMALCLIVQGAGRFSIDRWLSSILLPVVG